MSSLAAIIPVYNRPRRLKRALDSVLAQTRMPDEIIVVDDGSTDDTTSDFEDRFPMIRLITQRNSGVSAARNAGIRAASAMWIAFLDSDDVWDPAKCRKQMDALRDNPDFKLCHTEEKWIYKGAEKPIPMAYRKKGGRIFADCLARCAISPSTAIVARDLLVASGGFDESLPVCEDYDLWIRIAGRFPVLLVDEPLIEKHGGREDQLSNQRGLDVYRIKALQNLLRTTPLERENRDLAVEALIRRCGIVANGLEKRQRFSEAKRYREIVDACRRSPLKFG